MNGNNDNSQHPKNEYTEGDKRAFISSVYDNSDIVKLNQENEERLKKLAEQMETLKKYLNQ